MEIQQRTRNQTLVIRLNDVERAELDALAEHERVSISDIVRRLVRAEHDKKIGKKGKK
jgi:hypothetical protein